MVRIETETTHSNNETHDNAHQKFYKHRIHTISPFLVRLYTVTCSGAIGIFSGYCLASSLQATTYIKLTSAVDPLNNYSVLLTVVSSDLFQLNFSTITSVFVPKQACDPGSLCTPVIFSSVCWEATLKALDKKRSGEGLSG